MSRLPLPSPGAWLLAGLLLTPQSQLVSGSPLFSPSPPTAATQAAEDLENRLFIGGCGGVYFLAEPGELVIDVAKRDLNRRGSPTELRAILAGPDRQVLGEAVIPDDGQGRGSGLGPIQTCRLTALVKAKGVFVLNITVSQDRYGEEMIWAFHSNCPKYVVETARGHKDERHQEPIVLVSPNRPADLCFLPRAAAFEIAVSGLPKASGALELFDGQNQLLAKLAPDDQGQLSHRVPARAAAVTTPWRLHFPMAQGTVHLDGLTRWERGDRYQDMACWTPDPDSWFSFLEHRWLITPYHQLVYGMSEETRKVAFLLHNNSTQPSTLQLSLEFPDQPWPVHLSSERVTLDPRQDSSVTVTGTVPPVGQSRVARVRVTPEDDPSFTTFTTITFQEGAAPATRPLALPLQLQPYQHENEQLGYLPAYPVENQVYFDLENRPFVVDGDAVLSWWNGHWDTSLLRNSVTVRPPELENADFLPATTKVAFDEANHVYLLATAGRQAAVLYSTNGGRTFSACLIPGRENQPRSFDLEIFTGQNTPTAPPAILRYTRTAADPNLIWRRLNDLELFLPRKEGGRLVLGDPIPISQQCLGLSAHSGIPAAVISRGTKTHLAWGEATDPKVNVPGVPTFVATYDRAGARLSDAALVAYGLPPNDVHNSPSITMDEEGYLHLLAGTHGQPFPYARSLVPNDSQAGWSEPVPASQNARPTYIGLVCGPDGTLHSVFRMWRSGVAPFPASHHATLAYQRKRPGQAWETPQILVVAPFSEYSIFYHRLTIDRKGRLFLSYDYWSTHWFYRNDHYGNRRALMMSPDGGDTWKLATSDDLW